VLGLESERVQCNAVNCVDLEHLTHIQLHDCNSLYDQRLDTSDVTVGAAYVQAFVIKLENWLFGKEYAYLISDTPTAADVCIGLWLAQACEQVSLNVLPQQCLRLVTTMAHHPLLKDLAPSTLPQLGVVAATDEPCASLSGVETAVGDFADNAIVQKLVQLGMEHAVYSHELCVTAEELVAKVPLPSDDETHTKNLFLKDKKHGNFLITLHPDTKVNTKDLGTMLKLAGKTNLRMATPDILEDLLGCKPGTVGPLAILNDVNKEVTIVLDKALLSKTKIHSHPYRNDASVVVTPAALQEFIKLTEHEAVILEFPTMDTPAGGTAPKTAPPAKAPATAPAVKNKDKKNVEKGKTLLAVGFKKEENFSMWYSDVITLAEMISYYDISGCYILRPWSYKMWEMIQDWFNKEVRIRLSCSVRNVRFSILPNACCRAFVFRLDHLELKIATFLFSSLKSAWRRKRTTLKDLLQKLRGSRDLETVSSPSPLPSVRRQRRSCTLPFPIGSSRIAICHSSSTSGPTLSDGSSNIPLRS
jgi:hypothetical protein